MSDEGYTQAARILTLATPLGPDGLLATGLSVTEAISQPYFLRVDALAPKGKDFTFDQVLGQPAAVRWNLPSRRPQFYHGIVNRVTQGDTDTAFTRYELEVVPTFWLLDQTFQSRIYVRKTAVEILRDVLKGVPHQLNLSEKYPKREFCAQYRETDFAFASRLMEEEGIWYYFKHAADGHTMVLGDNPAAHPDWPEKLRLKHFSDGNTAHEEAVNRLGKSQQLVPGRVQLRDHHFQLPHDPLAADQKIRREVPVGQVTHKLAVGPVPSFERYDYPGEYARRFDGVDFSGNDQPASLNALTEDNVRTAKLRMEAQAVRSVELNGTSSVQGLAAGHRVVMEAVDQYTKAQKADGEYVVTAVTHTLKNANQYYGSSGDDEFSYANGFACIPYGAPYRPPVATPHPRIDGVQTAVVVGPPGEEIFTDKYGRIKVHFLWDRSDSNDGSNSPWIRVGTPHAGKGFGGVCIPRVGEEVIVSFLEGNPDRPIAVGRVYNEREKPPFQLPQKKMISGMKSNTYPGGGGDNEISMDDTKGAERMYVHAQYNQDEVVDHDQTSHVKNNRTKTVDVDETTTIGNNRTEKVVVDEKIDIGSNRTETVGANETLTVGANRTETIGMNHTETIGMNRTITTGMMQTETVALAATLNVGAAYAITVGGAMNVGVAMMAAEEVGMTKTIVVGEKLEIVVGASRLVMEAGGKVTIEGSEFLFAATGNFKLNGKVIDLN